jgi:membrane-bound lytic murein transglycosylase F
MPYWKSAKNWLPWCKPAIAICSAALLTSYAQVPDLLDQIKALGELRVVTRTGPLAFYRDADDMPQGPEYELARRFADELGVRLKIMPADSYAQVYAALKSGLAHLAAAGLKIPAEPVAGIVFGPAYQHVGEHLVYRHGATRPDSMADIRSGELVVAAGDPQPPSSAIRDADLDTRSLLDAVAAGRLRYTIADSTEFALAHDLHPDLRIAFDLGRSESLAWAASGRDPDFLREIRRYFAGMDVNGELPVIMNRYYGRTESLEFGESGEFMRHLHSRLPLYRRWFEEAALQSSEDWRLLAAIGYQESKWDPGAANPSGARGLMQLTHQTADEADVSDPGDARESIFGAARYFRELYGKIPAHVPEPDRTWFALAAYNIGFMHLEDARVLAQRAGLDPDSWRDVSEFLPSGEPVRYVENVRSYRDLLEWVWGGTVALN